jgi:anaerobic selenocysteine-containing dehydrogenase
VVALGATLALRREGAVVRASAAEPWPARVDEDLERHRTWQEPMSKAYARLTHPLVRDGDRETGTLRPATWDEALDRAAAGFRAAVDRQGPTTFGLFSCSKATNELNFATQKLARAVIGSNNIDSCNRT